MVESKQANKQTNKQTNERTNEQTNIVTHPPLIEQFSAQLQNCECWGSYGSPAEVTGLLDQVVHRSNLVLACLWLFFFGLFGLFGALEMKACDPSEHQ